MKEKVIIRIWIIASQSEGSEVGVFGNRATDYGRHHYSDVHQWEAERTRSFVMTKAPYFKELSTHHS